MTSYGTYQRFEYQTVRLPSFRVSWNGGAVRALALSVALTCLIALAMIAAYMLVAALTPIVVAACSACVVFAVAAAPIVAQFVGGMMLIAVLAWVGYPRSK